MVTVLNSGHQPCEQRFSGRYVRDTSQPRHTCSIHLLLRSRVKWWLLNLAPTVPLLSTCIVPVSKPDRPLSQLWAESQGSCYGYPRWSGPLHSLALKKCVSTPIHPAAPPQTPTPASPPSSHTVARTAAAPLGCAPPHGSRMPVRRGGCLHNHEKGWGRFIVLMQEGGNISLWPWRHMGWITRCDVHAIIPGQNNGRPGSVTTHR
jgi:hypothetical protein